MDGERGENPSCDAVVAEHLCVADEILISSWLAVDDNAEHVEDGVAMAVERRSRQRVSVGHTVFPPLLAEFLEGQPFIRPERIDDPRCDTVTL